MKTVDKRWQQAVVCSLRCSSQSCTVLLMISPLINLTSCCSLVNIGMLKQQEVEESQTRSWGTKLSQLPMQAHNMVIHRCIP